MLEPQLSMSRPRPTLLQTVFNQPSQKYASKRPSSPPSATVSTSASSTAVAQDTRIRRASEKLYDVTHRLSPSEPPSDNEEMFFTPPTSPPISVSSLPDDDDDPDELFSYRSPATSVTSVTDPSPPKQNSLPRARSRRATLPAWSRGVRWLVPPNSMSKPRPASHTGGIHDLDLVDVDYQRPSPKSKSRNSTQSYSSRMSAVLEEDEDDEHAAARARTGPPPARHTRSATVTIPSPLPVSAGSLPPSAYTSLTLPRAAYTPSKYHISSSVDITLSGLAQTTMATISISARPRPATPAHLRPQLPSQLAFSSHTPPPAKVHARHILVQVFAVALDPLDAQIVDHRASRDDGLGFIPGRSFVGRAIETGFEVTDIRRGDWLLGLTDVRKCGALAEFIVVHRRRVHPSHPPGAPLTLEQLAALPLAGVPAHRAVRTLAHLPRAGRVLVLAAHTGPGLLVAQELVAQGRHVIAHIPPSVTLPSPFPSPFASPATADVNLDVRPGPADQVLTTIAPATIDGVVDTVGGKAIWSAARTALRPAGQFTTLVGDDDDDRRGAVRRVAHLRSTMRSLFAAGPVGYQWVTPAANVDAEGADVRDSLGAIVRLAADGIFRPHVGRVIPLERAPDAFAAADQAPVVRIVD